MSSEHDAPNDFEDSEFWRHGEAEEASPLLHCDHTGIATKLYEADVALANFERQGNDFWQHFNISMNSLPQGTYTTYSSLYPVPEVVLPSRAPAEIQEPIFPTLGHSVLPAPIWKELPLIDYSDSNCQTQYTDRVRFRLRHGEEGLPLAAVPGRGVPWGQLDKEDAEAFDDAWEEPVNTRIHFRLQASISALRSTCPPSAVLTYLAAGTVSRPRPADKQIRARRETPGRQSIPLGELARVICERVRWAIVAQEPYYKGRRFALEHLRLMELRRVAKASWQPVLHINETALLGL
ncbi:uncharacterized protein BXZ73DRAFT_79322 [Epithele typhae]|uniref:uncharacterized protein n=1 Tax=Epithele typhae TaxID=378194 RepID=UPI0020085316|nr:uncharacterized protein BXZ73DRAFT_79322 [Epithele typhae]KAH9923916.1 hypothetical protein BXZ73DRAFT_79322 [Epithele typhae]